MNLQALEDKDTLKKVKQDYLAGEATYEDMKAAAIKVLKNMQAAELKIKGRVTTKITPASIAGMLR